MLHKHNVEATIIHRHHNPFMQSVIMTTIVMTTEGVEDITKKTRNMVITGITGGMIAERE